MKVMYQSLTKIFSYGNVSLDKPKVLPMTPTWPATPGGRLVGPCPTPLPPVPFFCVAKNKNEDKGKKEKVSKQKLSKDFHQVQNIIVLAILERLGFKNFSCRPTMVADNTFIVPWPPNFQIHFTGPALQVLLPLILMGLQYILRKIFQ